MTNITVKELRLRLENLDDDALVFISEDHMEKGRILVQPSIRGSSFEVQKINCTDAFDYTSYTTEVARETPDGKKCYIL